MSIKVDIERTASRLFSKISDDAQIKVIGINGLDCSGKTTLAKALYEVSTNAGVIVKLLHVDDYNNAEKQAELYGAYAEGAFGPAQLDDYYQNSVNYDLLRKTVIDAQQGVDLLIVEGVFLYKPILASLFDYKVLLKVKPELGFERYKKRKAEVGDTRPASVFNDIWVPAYKRYEKKCRVIDLADITFDMSA